VLSLLALGKNESFVARETGLSRHTVAKIRAENSDIENALVERNIKDRADRDKAILSEVDDVARECLATIRRVINGNNEKLAADVALKFFGVDSFWKSRGIRELDKLKALVENESEKE
jgi:DNA-binding NarL/FixJ family response regulator